MTKDQERHNRSTGQRIRRANEKIDALAEGQERTANVIAQHDRDIKVMKARLSAVEEHERSQK